MHNFWDDGPLLVFLVLVTHILTLLMHVLSLLIITIVLFKTSRCTRY